MESREGAEREMVVLREASSHGTGSCWPLSRGLCLAGQLINWNGEKMEKIQDRAADRGAKEGVTDEGRLSTECV